MALLLKRRRAETRVPKTQTALDNLIKCKKRGVWGAAEGSRAAQD
jgi:hypothetical protein